MPDKESTRAEPTWADIQRVALGLAAETIQRIGKAAADSDLPYERVAERVALSLLAAVAPDRLGLFGQS